MKRLIHEYLWPYKYLCLFAILMAMISAVTFVIQARLMQPILDEIFIYNNSHFLFYICLSLMMTFIIRSIAGYIYNFVISYMNHQISSTMYNKIYNNLLKLDQSFYHSKNTNFLLSNFANEVKFIQDNLSTFITQSIKDITLIVGLIISMSLQSLQSTLIIFFATPLILIPLFKINIYMRRYTKEWQNKFSKIFSSLGETLSNIKIIQAFNQENREISLMRQKVDSALYSYLKTVKLSLIVPMLLEIIIGVVFASSVYLGGIKVINKEISPGTLFSFTISFMILYRPIKNLSTANNILQQLVISAKTVFQLTDQKPTIINDPTSPTLNIITGNIDLNNITFKYEDNIILDNINMNIKGGKVTAIVGKSGSGKSTIINLLLRFYSTTNSDSNITIDNQNINECSLFSVRQNIALVSQDNLVFDDTILNNIKYASPDAPLEKIIEVAKIAQAHQFIELLPQKYESRIGQKGVKLSGGEKQRIAIARALLSNRPIILLDEATSALDHITECKLMESFQLSEEKKTIILISHRISTIKNADHAYILHEGKVIANGNHKELIDNNKLYQDLFSDQ